MSKKKSRQQSPENSPRLEVQTLLFGALPGVCHHAEQLTTTLHARGAEPWLPQSLPAANGRAVLVRPLNFKTESMPRLQKASAVLTALVYSLDRGLDTEQAGDAASVALDLIEQAIAALDTVELKGRAP